MRGEIGRPGATGSAEPPGITFAGITDEAGSALEDQIAALGRLGWRGIELRTVDGVAIADLDDRAFGRVAEALAAAGLRTVCVDSRIAGWARPITAPFTDDVAELTVLARRCATLGTRLVRVMSYPNAGLDDREWARRVRERMRALARHAEDAGLVLVHENCAGWAGRHADRMLDLVESVDSPALRLLFDTGNGIAYGYDGHEILPRILPYVVHVHVKDADGPYGDPRYTLPGEGACRVAECLRLLLDHGFTGSWSIEPHLRVRPHEHRTDAGPDGVELFVRYGRALERLVRERVTGTLEGAR